jgi:hypothetical protein
MTDSTTRTVASPRTTSAQAKRPAGETLGLKVTEKHGLLAPPVRGGRLSLVYSKPDRVPDAATLVFWPYRVPQLHDIDERAGATVTMPIVAAAGPAVASHGCLG